MNHERPLLAVMLKVRNQYIDYELYHQAYGLEMQIDDEWKLDAVLLTPAGHLRAVTKNTGVTSEDTAIVSAGISSLPDHPETYEPDTREIDDPQNNWVLLGNPESGESIGEKLIHAVKNGCRVIACLNPERPEKLFNVLKQVPAEFGSRVSLAYLAPNVNDLATLSQHVEKIQKHLLKFRPLQISRLLISGQVNARNAEALLAIPGVQGFLLREKDYADVLPDILQLMHTIGK